MRLNSKHVFEKKLLAVFDEILEEYRNRCKQGLTLLRMPAANS